MGAWVTVVKKHLSILLEDFLLEGIQDDVTSFVIGCLYCILTRSGEIFPRPLGNSLYVEIPKEA